MKNFFTKEKTCAVYSKCTATQTTNLIGSTFRKVLQGKYEIIRLDIKVYDIKCISMQCILDAY